MTGLSAFDVDANLKSSRTMMDTTMKGKGRGSKSLTCVPDDVLLEIFSFLDPYTVVSLFQVSGNLWNVKRILIATILGMQEVLWIPGLVYSLAQRTRQPPASSSIHRPSGSRSTFRNIRHWRRPPSLRSAQRYNRTQLALVLPNLPHQTQSHPVP